MRASDLGMANQLAAAGNGRQPELLGPLPACSSVLQSRAESVPKGIDCIYPFPPVESRDSIFFLLLFAASARCMEELRSRKQDHTKAKAGLDCLVTLQPSIPSINPYIHFYRIISLSWCIYYTFQNKCTSNQSSDISLRIINISIFIYLIRFKNIYYSFRPVYKTLPACSLVFISQN
jgi:hypothetical protein